MPTYFQKEVQPASVQQCSHKPFLNTEVRSWMINKQTNKQIRRQNVIFTLLYQLISDSTCLDKEGLCLIPQFSLGI